MLRCGRPAWLLCRTGPSRVPAQFDRCAMMRQMIPQPAVSAGKGHSRKTGIDLRSQRK